MSHHFLWRLRMGTISSSKKDTNDGCFQFFNLEQATLSECLSHVSLLSLAMLIKCYYHWRFSLLKFLCWIVIMGINSNDSFRAHGNLKYYKWHVDSSASKFSTFQWSTGTSADWMTETDHWFIDLYYYYIIEPFDPCSTPFLPWLEIVCFKNSGAGENMRIHLI